MPKSIKIVTIVGARPQFIKAATISRAIEQNFSGSIEEIIIHTGQHYDKNMSDIFFQEMNIPKPKYRLNINKQHHGAMTGSMLVEIEPILITENPHCVLLYGDTNSTLAGALAAKKLHIPVAHVEAGMRSFNKKIPEEVNRVLTDHVSDYFFCTSEEPSNNLKKENLTDNIFIVGDTMLDAVLFYKDRAIPPQKLAKKITNDIILATVHRQENTNSKKNLLGIFSALDVLSKKNKIILPLHPRTKKYLSLYNIDVPKYIITTEPLGYFEMLYLLKKAKLVITDSGGLQKEAYYFNTPSVVLRNETEWKELVELGITKLSGSDESQILQDANKLQDLTVFPSGLYGKGDTASKILSLLLELI